MKTLKILPLFLIVITSSAQDQLNTITLEALGMGGLMSVNYERQVETSSPVSFKIGLGYIPEILNENFLTVPYGIYYNFNHEKKWVLEMGIGSTMVIKFQDNPCGSVELSPCNKGKVGLDHLFFTSIGVKKYFGTKRQYLWKFNFNPVVSQVIDGKLSSDGLIPWFGISIGTRF